MYELRNITYLPWVNVSTSYKTLLDRATLNNPNSEAKQIYGSVKYGFVEKVHVNVSTIYNKNLDHLPLLFEHAGAVLELNDLGIGGVDVTAVRQFILHCNSYVFTEQHFQSIESLFRTFHRPTHFGQGGSDRSVGRAPSTIQC